LHRKREELSKEWEEGEGILLLAEVILGSCLLATGEVETWKLGRQDTLLL